MKHTKPKKKIINGEVFYLDHRTFSYYPMQEFREDLLYRDIKKPKRKRKKKEDNDID